MSADKSERERCPRDSDWCDGELCRADQVGFRPDCPNADPPVSRIAFPDLVGFRRRTQEALRIARDAQRIRLRGGLRDGQLVDRPIIGARAIGPGAWEDRRLAGYDEYGVPLWAYPTEVYERTSDRDEDGVEIWEHSRTEPA